MFRQGYFGEAVFPIPEIREKYPLTEPTALTSDNDWRRVRALAVDVMEHAALSGHTIMPCTMLVENIKTLVMEPACTVTTDIMDGIDTLIHLEIIRREMKDGMEYYKLVRMNEFDQIIEKRIGKRLKDPKLNVNADWGKILNTKWKEQGFSDKNLTEDEKRARTEKAAVLKVLAESRISVLVGDAGTGKTTVLATLCAEDSIKAGGALLLAPTSKATVRLMESIAEPCRILSREMLYTALTRQKSKIIILYNKKPIELLKYSYVAHSDIAKRFTDLFADVFSDYKPQIVENGGEFYKDKLIHRTARGEMVRSKSEVIIANALYYNDIPYKYEPDLVVEDLVKKPDFEIVDADTGITWYWEHCGMMTDPKYKKDGWIKKLSTKKRYLGRQKSDSYRR